MRVAVLAFFIFLLVNQSQAQNWQLIWSDEFNGSSLNSSKWSHSIGTGDNGWGNGELQYYQPQNSIVSNGKLNIEAREEPQGILGQWNQPYYYSSSKVTTQGKFDFRYGKVEARMKTIDGEGFWPAFWLLPNGGCWPEDGEIDIMEQWGNDGPTNETSGATHVGNGCQGSSIYQSWNTTISGSYADNYHVYSVIWHENFIGWYVDDILKHHITPTTFSGDFVWPFNQDNWYIILNLAITNEGPNNNTVFPNAIDIDYVRVYQTNDVLGCTNPNATNYNPNADIDDGSCIEIINFNVDMNCSGENPQTVYITGPFNDWCCNCHPMTDADGDGIWSANYSFGNNDGQFEYKYCFDNWAGQENLVDDVQSGNGSCVEVTDNSTYANRKIYLSGFDITTNDVYGQCNDCIAGCTDINAFNYDSEADFDDGSCEYDCSLSQVSFSINMGEPLADGYSTVVINGSWDDWQGWGVALQDDDNDFIWEGTAQLPSGSNQYVVALTGESDNYSGWGIVGNAPIGSSCDYFPNDSYGNYGFDAVCGDNIQLPTVCFNSCDNCVETISGCTDPIATNYNSEATVNDNSCEYAENPCDIVPSGLSVDNIIHNRVVFNWSAPTAAPSHYMIRYREVGTTSWTVMTAGPVNANAFTGTSRTRYFMEPGTTYQWNIRARVLNEDGSMNCQSSWSASSQYTTLDACANLENLSVSTEANWATLSADAPDASWGVWQSKAKMRVVGTNSFRYANGSSDGSISVLKGNFTPSTDYEWHTKAWCTGNVDANGDSDPMYHSGWGEFSSFTTEAPCDKMPVNLTTSTNGAQTAITMSWDTPESGAPDHYFLELNNDNTGQQWQWNNISGSSNSKTKFNLSQGQYSWRIRGACGTNGTSWATIYSQPAGFNLGGSKLESKTASGMNVYPNPSKAIFNVSFNTNKSEDIVLEVTNFIGQEVLFKPFNNSAKLNTQIDLSKYPKGIYNLNIKTSDGISNHKLILQ